MPGATNFQVGLRDNNWHLFFVLVDRVLDSLGHPGTIPDARARYERIRDFHTGDGWFRDGPQGRVDYYSAWGFQYALDWISRIDPNWDPAFIESCSRRFLPGFSHLIGSEGLPILGRSIPYRLALPAPLVAGCDKHPDLVAPGMARRSLDAVWSHFVQNGAVGHGYITSGYYRRDARLQDPSSGPASSLWSLRSLIAAIRYPPTHPFWTSAPEPLPVEKGDYELLLHGPGWKVRGEQSTQRISVQILGSPLGEQPALDSFGPLDQIRNYVRRHPERPRNIAAKYNRTAYSSDGTGWMG